MPFTVFEFIAVLLLVAILAAVAIGRGMSHPELPTEEALLGANLRHAQTLAMNATTATWSVVFAADRYTLYEGGATAASYWPNETSAVHVLANGVTFNPVPSPLIYDSYGNPGPNDITITLTDGSGDTATVTVVGVTGFVR
jgi:hypothetical protein